MASDLGEWVFDGLFRKQTGKEQILEPKLLVGGVWNLRFLYGIPVQMIGLWERGLVGALGTDEGEKMN